MNENEPTLKIKLLQIMVCKSINQKQLAQELHIDPGTVSRWLSGISEPTNIMAMKIDTLYYTVEPYKQIRRVAI